MVHLCGHVHSAVLISAVCVSYAVDVYGLFWVKPCREHNAVRSVHVLCGLCDHQDLQALFDELVVAAGWDHA